MKQNNLIYLNDLNRDKIPNTNHFYFGGRVQEMQTLRDHSTSAAARLVDGTATASSLDNLRAICTAKWIELKRILAGPMRQG
jgi:hypothetical protein